MDNILETLGTFSFLSSGMEIDGDRIETLPSIIFDFLGASGKWAGAVADLIGLVD